MTGFIITAALLAVILIAVAVLGRRRKGAAGPKRSRTAGSTGSGSQDSSGSGWFGEILDTISDWSSSGHGGHHGSGHHSSHDYGGSDSGGSFSGGD